MKQAASEANWREVGESSFQADFHLEEHYSFGSIPQGSDVGNSMYRSILDAIWEPQDIGRTGEGREERVSTQAMVVLEGDEE